MANRIKVAVSSTILTLHEQGWSFRRIARTLGIHRETANGGVIVRRVAA